MSFSATWMDLEITILREVREIQSNMCYHLTVESKIKKDTNTLSYKTETDPQTENQLMITKGKRELEGGIN